MTKYNIKDRTRECTWCSKLIKYETVNKFYYAIESYGLCEECKNLQEAINKKYETFERNCPSCNESLVYKTKGAKTLAIKRNAICRKCASIKSGFTERYATKGNNIGEDNAQFGKPLSPEHREKLLNCDQSYKQSQKFKDSMSKVTKGEKNPMFGKTVYSVWLEKYGKEIADQKQIEYLKKQSKASSGENNPMYGKPSPQGSGNGWKGWYNDYHFRSLRELCYLIFLDENNINWKSGESIKINYINYDGKNRTYRPDFIIGNELVEIKPIKLQKSPSVKLKTEAAIKYCEKNNLSYKIIDVEIEYFKIKKCFDSGMIRFYDKYKEKFESYLNGIN